MNKWEMADRLAVGTGLNKAEARDAVDGVFEAIGEALANGDEVRIAGFGTFSVKSRPARTGRNPPDRRARFDIGVQISVLQVWQDAQGFAECRSEDVSGG